MATDDPFSRERAAGYDPTLLSTAKVLLVGAGALGQNLALDLALSGVGTLAVVDFDHFEEHNITRSPLFPTPLEQARLGLGKAVTVAHALRRLATAPNAHVLYSTHPVQTLGLGVFAQFDVVVSAVDSDLARAHLSEACLLARVPLVMGGFDGSALNYTLHTNASTTGPCWRCSNPAVTDAHALSCTAVARLHEAQGITPALQTGAAALGAFIAEAVIELLHGRSQLADHRVALDVRSGRSQLTRLAHNPECPLSHEADLRDVRPVQLPTGATVRDLLRCLTDAGVRRPVVTLPSAFVESAPCGRCGRSVEVGRTLAELVGAPTCTGPCESNHATLGKPALTRATLSSDDEGLLEIACPVLGVRPFSLLETVDEETGDVTTFMPIGSLEDVFQRVSDSE